MDLFIGRASEDAEFGGQNVQWFCARPQPPPGLDCPSIRFGVMLERELLSAIQDNRVMVQLWSEAAARWIRG